MRSSRRTCSARTPIRSSATTGAQYRNWGPGGIGTESRTLSRRRHGAVGPPPAKKTNLPLHALLGGAVRPQDPRLQHVRRPGLRLGDDDRPGARHPRRPDGRLRPRRDYEDLKAFHEEPERLAEELLDMGFHAMKIWPLDPIANDTNGNPAPSDSRSTRGLEPLRRIREAPTATGSRSRSRCTAAGTCRPRSGSRPPPSATARSGSRTRSRPRTSTPSAGFARATRHPDRSRARATGSIHPIRPTSDRGRHPDHLGRPVVLRWRDRPPTSCRPRRSPTSGEFIAHDCQGPVNLAGSACTSPFTPTPPRCRRWSAPSTSAGTTPFVTGQPDVPPGLGSTPWPNPATGSRSGPKPEPASRSANPADRRQPAASSARWAAGVRAPAVACAIAPIAAQGASRAGDPGRPDLAGCASAARRSPSPGSSGSPPGLGRGAPARSARRPRSRSSRRRPCWPCTSPRSGRFVSRLAARRARAPARPRVRRADGADEPPRELRVGRSHAARPTPCRAEAERQRMPIDDRFDQHVEPGGDLREDLEVARLHRQDADAGRARSGWPRRRGRPGPRTP